MLYPPRPSNISIPAVIAGNILQNEDTSISAIDSGFDGTVVVRTQNKIAMIINPEQKTSINTDSTESMLTINNDLSTTSTFRMSYQNRFYFDGRITTNGNVLFIPSCDDPILNPNLVTSFKKNVNIDDHDGMRMGLSLGGNLITASATELNYVDVPAGVSRPNKALVLNSQSSITGINLLSASQLTGTLLTADQPNISSLRTVNITDSLFLKGSLFKLTPTSMGYLEILSEGIAYPSKAMILDHNKNFTGINNLVAANITGVLTSGPQPNISSLSALTSLTNNGPTNFNDVLTITADVPDQLVLKFSDTHSSSIGTNGSGDMVLRSSSRKILIPGSHNFDITGHDGVSNGLMLGGFLVTASAAQVNYTNVVPGTAGANRALVLDGSRNILGVGTFGASVIFGTINTASQPNIKSVSTLNITDHDGINGLSLKGSIVNSSAAQLNYVNVVPGTAQENKALVLNNLKNVSGVNLLSASQISGVITTEVQPNINQVNRLTILGHNGTAGLVLGTTLVTATGTQLNRLNVAPGEAVDERALVLDSSKNIIGINNLGAINLSGTITTPLQPNIEEVNVLDIKNHDGDKFGLSLKGTLVTATAEELNRTDVSPGIAGANKAVVLNSSFSISGINTIGALFVGGVLTNHTQPNIRNLTSINITDHNGTNGLSLNGVLVESSANQLNYVRVELGTAQAGKALVLDSSRNIDNINSLTAATLNGVIGTSNQPYINRVSTLNVMNHDGSSSGLSLNGTLITSTADQINSLTVTPGLASSRKAIILDNGRNIQNINTLLATSLGGVLLTANQPNVNSVNILNIANHNGSTGLSLGGTLVTANAEAINRIDTRVGVAVAGKALVVDSLLNISNINSINANSFTGTIQTSHQPNINSLSTLNITNHDGSSRGLSLNGTLVSATANQLNFNAVVPGRASSSKSMVTDIFNSISGINTLSATNVVTDELALKGVLSNFNVGGVIIKSYSFTDLIGRLIDIQLLETFNFTRFSPDNLTSGYSCEIIGYIYPQHSETYTFFVTCNDRVRLWVNGELILHSWIQSPTPRSSSSIFMNADQWVPIYIQYQVDLGSVPMFLLEWSSTNTMRSRIPSDRMAWDNNPPPVTSKQFSQNSLTIYNTVTTNASTARFSVDTSGDLIIDASGNDIALGSGDNFNIPSHDGVRGGLFLGGVLVRPTAFELNYLKVNPGIVGASQAVVTDASKSITGINSIKAISIACDSLSTESFTINNLSLSGPLNNYNIGSLLIRQFTGPDVTGRIVNVNTISDLNLSGYDPTPLNTNFSLDIQGFILPPSSDSFRFFAIANDRVRIWINNRLILNSWDTNSGIEFESVPVPLILNQWTRIYIQFQNIIGTSSLQIRWSSSTVPKSSITSDRMAWDNSFTNPINSLNSADQLTIFSSTAGLTEVQSGSVAVDSFGNMNLSCRSGIVNITSPNNFNIVGHNGTTRGLQLAGTLVRASAAELNYLSGAFPGEVSASKVLVLDSTKSLSGLTTLSSTNLIGTCLTASQPNITSIGTLTTTLNTTSNILIDSSNLFKLSADINACYIQAGSDSSVNSAADLFVGNYDSSINGSSRKFMIKSTGFVGIQTSLPNRTLSVNGGGTNHCMRLIHNSSNGNETAFCDIGCDQSSNLIISSNVIIGSSGTASIAVNETGIMKITPSGGSIQIGNTTNSTLPLEVGSAPFTLTSATGFLNSEGTVGSVIPSATSYSLRTNASIVVNGTVCVTSDHRLKESVNELDYEKCKKFILNSKPVNYKYKNDPLKALHCGLIAQDVVKTDFSNLVKVAPHGKLSSHIDIDGFVSPENAAFNIAYEEIIPIIMTTMKEVLNENALLKTHLLSLSEKLKDMELKMSTLFKSSE